MYFEKILPNNWIGVRRNFQKIESNLLGPVSSPTYYGLTLTGLTDNSLIYPVSGLLTSLGIADNGKIPIGSTGTTPVLALITGTANQVVSTPGAGSITLSLPQDIHTGASPQFAAIEMGHVSDTTFTRVSAGVAAIEGDNIIMASEWSQNGFPNRTDSTIAFNDGTRRFTINPSGSSFAYYIAGVKYTVSSSDVENVNYIYLGDTPAEGPWFIYYVGNTLTASVNPNHAAVRDIFENKAVVAIVFWDADNSKSQLLEERHGTSMSPFTHVLLHETMGTRFDGGLALNSITADENGNVNSHAQFGIDAGSIFDEDIEHTLNAVGSTTGLQIWYQDTSGWTFTTNAGYSMVKTGIGGEDRLAYDNSGTLTEVGDGNFVLCHVFASSMTHLNPIVAIGQSQYTTKKLARQGAVTEITSILSIANISPELKPVASVIFQTKDTYSNAMRAKIVSTDEGDDYVDFRTDALNPAFSSAQAHGNLAGLLNDDHTQYLLADGTRALTGNMAVDATVTIDGRDVSADGAQLDEIYPELVAWLDDVVLEDGGAITTTQVATFAQLVLTPRASALSAVEGAMFYDSDDNNVYVCIEGA